MKHIIYILLGLICIHSNAQTFYVNSGVNSNQSEDSAFFVNSNRTYQLNVNNCDSAKIYTCLPTNGNNNNFDYFYLDMAIDTVGNLYWVSLEGGLYTRKLNDSTSCEFLGVFDSDYIDVEVNALVADVNGNLLAVGTNDVTGIVKLYEYQQSTTTFRTLGILPEGFSSSGDLFFYEGKLFWTAYNSSNNDAFLAEITIADPSQSCNYMDLGNLKPYAAFSIQNNTCSDAYIISAGDSSSTLYRLDLYAKTISTPICTYSFVVNGAASV